MKDATELSTASAGEAFTYGMPERKSDGDYLICAKGCGASVVWQGDNAGVHFTTESWAAFCNALRATVPGIAPAGGIGGE